MIKLVRITSVVKKKIYKGKNGKMYIKTKGRPREVKKQLGSNVYEPIW